mmetsp:Transcript_15544/g.33601  ORF Transcript_15544/g.33601 Transcript_15544/m.33601 type:complete len:264 (+) Transcript_15544:843-1634(+)
MEYKGIRLAQSFRMLGEANVHGFDRRSQGLHDGENQCVAKEKGDDHVQGHRRIGHTRIVSIPLVHQDRPGEQNNNPGDTSTDACAHVCGDIVVDDGFDTGLVDQYRNLLGGPRVGHLVVGDVAHGHVGVRADKIPRNAVDSFHYHLAIGQRRRRRRRRTTTNGHPPHSPESCPGVIDLSYLTPYQLGKTSEQSALGHRTETDRESGCHELADGGRSRVPSFLSLVPLLPTVPASLRQQMVCCAPCTVVQKTGVIIFVVAIFVA